MPDLQKASADGKQGPAFLQRALPDNWSWQVGQRAVCSVFPGWRYLRPTRSKNGSPWRRWRL